MTTALVSMVNLGPAANRVSCDSIEKMVNLGFGEREYLV